MSSTICAILIIYFTSYTYGMGNKRILLTPDPWKSKYQVEDEVKLNCSILDPDFQPKEIYWYKIENFNENETKNHVIQHHSQKNFYPMRIFKNDSETQLIYCVAWPKFKYHDALISETIEIHVEKGKKFGHSNPKDSLFLNPILNSTVKLNDVIPIKCTGNPAFNMKLYQKSGDTLRTLSFAVGTNKKGALTILINKTISVDDDNSEIYCASYLQSSFSFIASRRLQLVINNKEASSVSDIITTTISTNFFADREVKKGNPLIYVYIAIPIGLTIFLVLIIVLICLRTKSREIERKCLPENDYAEVNYADIQATGGGKVLPVKEESPYAEIIGVLNKNDNIYSF